MNSSEKLIMNLSVNVRLSVSFGSSMTRYMNISICTSLWMNPNGNKNANVCEYEQECKYECIYV